MLRFKLGNVANLHSQGLELVLSPMKSLGLLFALALFAAPLAFAQDPVLVCVRASDGSCQWVPQVEVSSSISPPSVPAGAQPTLDQGNAASDVWFDWRAENPHPDPLMGKPGVCAKTAERARYRFLVAMQSGNLNKVIESYDWHGKSSIEAEHLTDRLAALPVNGDWERSVVSGWTGNDPGTSAKSNPHWRWSGPNGVTYFQMHEVNECWFIVFGAEPSAQDAPTGQRTTPSAASDPVSEAPGVYTF